MPVDRRVEHPRTSAAPREKPPRHGLGMVPPTRGLVAGQSIAPWRETPNRAVPHSPDRSESAWREVESSQIDQIQSLTAQRAEHRVRHARQGCGVHGIVQADEADPRGRTGSRGPRRSTMRGTSDRRLAKRRSRSRESKREVGHGKDRHPMGTRRRTTPDGWTDARTAGPRRSNASQSQYGIRTLVNRR